jgi:hypothetical protein
VFRPDADASTIAEESAEALIAAVLG